MVRDQSWLPLPTHDVAELRGEMRKADSVASIRITRVEERQQRIMGEMQEVKEQLRFVIYLQCVTIKPDQRPPTCFPIIQQARGAP